VGLRRRSARAGIVLLVAILLSSCVRGDLASLAGDAADGRDNGTAGSARAQQQLLGYLQAWTDGADATQTGARAYQQPFTGGTNLIGILPGTDLADEYVLVGAHYDHVGHNCRDLRPGDDICNGATDNAASVAAVTDVLRGFAYSPERPRRSIIFAFWDREEDGLLGSAYYVAHPLVPLADTVAYVNLDITGANLRPSLRNSSFAVGAETGGPQLAQLVNDAIAPGTLDMQQLSFIFGQNRSDHAVLVGAGVPSVFFTDATGPCYHTDSDDISVVDFAKLDQQIAIVRRLTTALATTDVLPVFVSNRPLATYDDARVMLTMLDALQADLGTFTATQAANIVSYRTELAGIVANGPAAFDSTAVTRSLTIAATVVGYFASGPCTGFLDGQ
jgi:hypothetical protein